MDHSALIGQGRTAEVFALGPDRVLKLYFPGFPRPAVDHEYRMALAASEAGVPTPAAFERVEQDSRSGVVYQRVEGVSMLQNLTARPWTLFATARRMAELHARIHRCALPPDAPSQKGEVRRGIERAAGLPEAVRAAALDRLERLPEGDRLCHGDFHPDNILVTARGPVIIDWLDGSRGTPLADVARTMLLLSTGGLPPGTPLTLRVLVSLTRGLLASTYLEHYLRHNPAPRSEVTAWKLPLLAARLSELDDYPREKQLVLSQVLKLAARSNQS